jgi:hypothetical protein
VQDGFEVVTTRQRHITGTNFILALMPKSEDDISPQCDVLNNIQETQDCQYRISVFCTSDISPGKCTSTYILLALVLYGILGKHNELKKIRSYTEISAF